MRQGTAYPFHSLASLPSGAGHTTAEETCTSDGDERLEFPLSGRSNIGLHLQEKSLVTKGTKDKNSPRGTLRHLVASSLKGKYTGVEAAILCLDSLESAES